MSRVGGMTKRERDNGELEEEDDWWPDVTDDSLRPHYTASGAEYYIEPDGTVFLGGVTLPGLQDP